MDVKDEGVVSTYMDKLVCHTSSILPPSPSLSVGLILTEATNSYGCIQE